MNTVPKPVEGADSPAVTGLPTAMLITAWRSESRRRRPRSRKRLAVSIGQVVASFVAAGLLWDLLRWIGVLPPEYFPGVLEIVGRLSTELGAGFGGKMLAATGQTVVYVVNLAPGAGGAYYYAGAGFDSSTMILTAPLGALGIEEGQTFSFSVYAFDNYFSGALTDYIEGQVFTAGEQLYAAHPYVEVDAKGRASLDVTATGATGESTQTGLLLLHQSAAEDDFSVVTVRR